MSEPTTHTAAAYLQRIRAAYPDLAIGRARLHTGEGQFNDILIVDEALIYRFPRTPQVAATLAARTDLLARLQSRLPLPIPNPIYYSNDPQTGMLQFMGYAMLPGAPLWSETLATIADDQTLDRLASQLAGFLRALHHLPAAEIAPSLPAGDQPEYWADLFAQFHAKLFPFMRPDACDEVARLFGALLDDLRSHPFTPALRHGDFGGSNILYDPQMYTIVGIIDFDFAGLGDPALDVAALSCYGEAFLARGYTIYPEMEQMLPRARLYRGTYALQQALYALRDGNQADFEDGIARYI
jgi:aminoglycoside 2''-phosphotransferase